MYKKLIYFGIFALLVPIVFIPEYKYITVVGFWVWKVMPDVQYHGVQLFFCLLVIASTMFFAGLVHPKISIWFGEKTRKRSSTIYGIVAVIAIAGLFEVYLIALGIYEYEDRQMVSFYEDIEIGNSVDEIQNLSISLNKHLGYSYSLSEGERNLITDDQNRKFVGFKYPHQFRTSRMRMIVETNLHPAHEDARIIGKFLLINYQITRSKIEKNA
jgi:hypothetical protein